jgi:hypothetical protein
VLSTPRINTPIDPTRLSFAAGGTALALTPALLGDTERAPAFAFFAPASLFHLMFSNPHRPFLLMAWRPAPAELRWAGPAVAFERPALT